MCPLSSTQSSLIWSFRPVMLRRFVLSLRREFKSCKKKAGACFQNLQNFGEPSCRLMTGAGHSNKTFHWHILQEIYRAISSHPAIQPFFCPCVPGYPLGVVCPTEMGLQQICSGIPQVFLQSLLKTAFHWEHGRLKLNWMFKVHPQVLIMQAATFCIYGVEKSLSVISCRGVNPVSSILGLYYTVLPSNAQPWAALVQVPRLH